MTQNSLKDLVVWISVCLHVKDGKIKQDKTCLINKIQTKLTLLENNFKHDRILHLMFFLTFSNSLNRKCY